MEGLVIDPNAVDVNQVPTYKDCILRVYQSLRYCYEDSSTEKYPYSFQGFISELKDHGTISHTDIGVALSGAVVWTLARYLLTWAIFAPISKSLKMKPMDTKKMPESMWKVIVYSILWGLSCHILFGDGPNNNLFSEPLTLWKDWSKGMDVGQCVYILYMAQFSFYLHSVYGTLLMDEWRKDSAVMLFHHFLTMSLIGFSYVMRYHKIGILVLFVHDVTDILLEFTKCNVYLKTRNKVYYPIHDHLSTVGFASFSVAWFVFRLYWYPLKVLDSSAYGCIVFNPMGINTPCFLFLNVMLLILQGLNMWWFTFIIVFLFNVLTGRMTELEDFREKDVEEEIEKSNRSNGAGTGEFTPRRSARNKGKKRA